MANGWANGVLFQDTPGDGGYASQSGPYITDLGALQSYQDIGNNRLGNIYTSDYAAGAVPVPKPGFVEARNAIHIAESLKGVERAAPGNVKYLDTSKKTMLLTEDGKLVDVTGKITPDMVKEGFAIPLVPGENVKYHHNDGTYMDIGLGWEAGKARLLDDVKNPDKTSLSGLKTAWDNGVQVVLPSSTAVQLGAKQKHGKGSGWWRDVVPAVVSVVAGAFTGGTASPLVYGALTGAATQVGLQTGIHEGDMSLSDYIKAAGVGAVAGASGAALAGGAGGAASTAGQSDVSGLAAAEAGSGSVVPATTLANGAGVAGYTGEFAGVPASTGVPASAAAPTTATVLPSGAGVAGYAGEFAGVPASAGGSTAAGSISAATPAAGAASSGLSASTIKGAAGLGSGVVSGLGQMKANAQNKAAASKLRGKARGYEQLADPLQNDLFAGWAPSGFLRKATAAQGIATAERGANKARTGNAANAWRYGGRTSGRFLGGQAQADRSKFLRIGDAWNRADAEGIGQLTRMDSLLRGIDNAYPVSVARNPYAGVATGVNQFFGQIDQQESL